MTDDIERNCGFQFATTRKVIVDKTGLSRFDAELLFEQHRNDFVQMLERDEEPEMCVWIDMKDEFDYHTNGSHWMHGDMVMRDGRMYELVY
jgi:hypothetical protein